MARIRTIKPEFFTSEDIVALSPMARLLYVALWCEADREGRMAWKPRTFKLRYFPGDACDIEALCAELTDAGLVVLYAGGDCAYVPAFLSHQHLNPREAASLLPDPHDSGSGPGDLLPVVRRRLRVTDASARVSDAQGGREGKGKEGEKEPYGSVASKPATAPPPSAEQAVPPLPPCPVDRVVEVYHEVLPELPRVRLMDERRKRAIGRVWRWVLSSKKPDGSPRATTVDGALDWVRDFFATARENDFLMGRGARASGHENWRCDLDFLFTDKGLKQVIEKTGGAA